MKANITLQAAIGSEDKLRTLLNEHGDHLGVIRRAPENYKADAAWVRVDKVHAATNIYTVVMEHPSDSRVFTTQVEAYTPAEARQKALNGLNPSIRVLLTLLGGAQEAEE